MNWALGANSMDLNLLANSFPMVLVWTTSLRRPEKRDNFTSLGLILFQECLQGITLVQGCIGQDNTKYGLWVNSYIRILVTMLANLNTVFSNLIWLKRSRWSLHWHFHASRNMRGWTPHWKGWKKEKSSMAIPPKCLMEMTKNMTKMRMMMSLMTETTVDLDQVVEKFQRSLLMTPRISSTKTKIQKRWPSRNWSTPNQTIGRRAKLEMGRYTSMTMVRRSSWTSRVTHTRLEMTVDECSERHCVPKGPILLKNGANSLSLTGIPSSKPRRRSWRRKRPMTKPKDWSKKRRRRQRRRRRKIQRKTRTSQSPRTMKVVMKVRRMTLIQSQRNPMQVLVKLWRTKLPYLSHVQVRILICTT